MRILWLGRLEGFVVFVCLILMALGCDRNGYKCRGHIVVEVVDSRRIIERAIGHEVSNEIDVRFTYV